MASTLATGAARAATIAWTAAQWLLNAALTANPIGLVVVAIGALIAGVVLAYRHSSTFRAGVQSLWEWLRKFIGFTPLGALITNFGDLRDAIGWVLDKLKAVAKKISSLPGLPDLTPGFDVPGVPFFAKGGILPRGLAVVGEKGPELLNTRGGGRVISNEDSRNLLGSGSGTTVHWQTQIIGSDRIIEDAVAEQARTLAFHLRTA